MSDVSPKDDAERGLTERAKRMIFAPSDEWPLIVGETDSVQDVLRRYVAPLAAIGPVANLIGDLLFGNGGLGSEYRPTLVNALTSAIVDYVEALASIFVIAWLAAFLAGRFGGRRDYQQAFKLCAYALTTVWVVGVFGLVPSLGALGVLGLYSLYVFYVGATPMVGVPEEKAGSFTLVTVIAAAVLYALLAAIGVAIRGSLTTI